MLKKKHFIEIIKRNRDDIELYSEYFPHGTILLSFMITTESSVFTVRDANSGKRFHIPFGTLDRKVYSDDILSCKVIISEITDIVELHAIVSRHNILVCKKARNLAVKKGMINDAYRVMRNHLILITNDLEYNIIFKNTLNSANVLLDTKTNNHTVISDIISSIEDSDINNELGITDKDITDMLLHRKPDDMKFHKPDSNKK